MSELADLADDEFLDELKESLADDAMWAMFTEPDVCQRTVVALDKVWLGLATHSAAKKPSKQDGVNRWAMYKKITRARFQVEARQRETRAALKAQNREQSASIEGLERKWGLFAERMAEALSGSDRAGVLDTLMLDGDLSAGQWLQLRRQRAVRQS